MVTYEQVKNSADIKTYLQRGEHVMNAIQYTEHGFAHATLSANRAAQVLSVLGYDERTLELAKIAGYMHDIGNSVNRHDHAQSGAIMAMQLLTAMGMPAAEVCEVVSAIGHHDEGTGGPVSAISAALILADKSDVRKSRVRPGTDIGKDIHDRVNYAVRDTKLSVDKENSLVLLTLDIDTQISAVMDYFEIFLSRMLLCRRAAGFFGMTFHLDINGLRLL